VCGALIAFSLNLNNYFLSDDFAQIGRVLSGDFSVTWGQEYGGFLRPLFILSYVVDSSLWRMHPFGYHLTNVIVHGANAFLVFQIGNVLFRDSPVAGKNLIAIAAGTLFLLHPSHTEAVSWISGRADLLATFFVLLALLLYLDYLASRHKWHLILAILSFGLALLAKESAICLPFLLLVFGWKHTKQRKHLLATIALFLAVLGAFIALRAYAIGAVVGGYGTSQHLNFSPGWIRDRLLEASIRAVMPALPDNWSTFLFKPLQSPLFYLIVIIAGGIITAAIIARRRTYDLSQRREQNQTLLMLVLAFLLSLLPVISLRLSLYETLGERFLYLPTVFSVLMIACLAAILVHRRRLCYLILIGLVCFYSISLYRTTRLWREASQLAFAITQDLSMTATTDQLVVLNAPDNLRGVPVFHNGLPEALHYFPKEKAIARVEILSFQDLRSVSDATELTTAAEGLILRALNPLDRFERVRGADCFDTMSVQANLLKVQRRCESPTDVFFFSNGKMNKL
jgi:hypothetical protein